MVNRPVVIPIDRGTARSSRNLPKRVGAWGTSNRNSPPVSPVAIGSQLRPPSSDNDRSTRPVPSQVMVREAPTGQTSPGEGDETSIAEEAYLRSKVVLSK